MPAYETGGARAVSVLVDAAFAGSLDDLRTARATTRMPLLAKGFFSTEEQLREVREAGADAALLILRDLDDATASRLLRVAEELGLDTLVEAHDDEELERATRLDARIIGVNARDLGTFRIDRAAQLELVAKAPRDRVVVAESAIHTRAQAAAAELAGGLGPENVRQAIETVHPWAVDAASSLEREPGVKDHAKVRAYVEAARS